jgi:predicted RNA methylase
MPRKKSLPAKNNQNTDKSAIDEMGKAISDITDALERYANAYNNIFDRGIGNDYVIGDHWKDVCEGVIGLLNGDTGNIDCAATDRRLRQLIERFFKTVGDDSLALPGSEVRAIPVDMVPMDYRVPNTFAEVEFKTTKDRVPGSDVQVEFPNAKKVLRNSPTIKVELVTEIGSKKLTDRQMELLTNVIIVNDNVAVFGGPQIDDWKSLKVVMEALGSKWKRQLGGFQFPDDVDALEIVDKAKRTGVIIDPKEADFFWTSDEVADRLVDFSRVNDRHNVLEPSAGNGALVKAIRRAAPGAVVTCVEALDKNYQALTELKPFNAIRRDFLTIGPGEIGTFDRIVMNPPFSKRADINHVWHAFRHFLAPGGILAAIMSGSVEYREDTLTKSFRMLVEENNGSIVKLPADSFKHAGTSVNTVMVRMFKE